MHLQQPSLCLHDVVRCLHCTSVVALACQRQLWQHTLHSNALLPVAYLSTALSFTTMNVVGACSSAFGACWHHCTFFTWLFTCQCGLRSRSADWSRCFPGIEDLHTRLWLLSSMKVCERQHVMLWVYKSVVQCAMQGVVLAATFAVSHNVEEAKPLAAGSPTTSSLQRPYAERDWGVQQVCAIHLSARFLLTPLSYAIL